MNDFHNTAISIGDELTYPLLPEEKNKEVPFTLSEKLLITDKYIEIRSNFFLILLILFIIYLILSTLSFVINPQTTSSILSLSATIIVSVILFYILIKFHYQLTLISNVLMLEKKNNSIIDFDKILNSIKEHESRLKMGIDRNNELFDKFLELREEKQPLIDLSSLSSKLSHIEEKTQFNIDQTSIIWGLLDKNNDYRYSIFLSHSGTNKDIAVILYKMFKCAKQKVWIDRLNIDEDNEVAIRKGIANSNVFLLIETLDSLTSKWVQKEITWATEKKMTICSFRPFDIYYKQYPGNNPDGAWSDRIEDLFRVMKIPWTNEYKRFFETLLSLVGKKKWSINEILN